VLGAMLPDLCSMAGLRVQTVLDPELARGVDLHHETDRRFHAHPQFLALCSSALESLEARGVSRAAARAVGHVGSELLLDGLLSDDLHARAAYGRALQNAIESQLASQVVFKQDERPEALRRVLGRLATAPIPEGYRDAGFVCDRLEVILGRRPRLAMRAEDREPVLEWLGHAAERLASERGVILNAVLRFEHEPRASAARSPR